MRSGPRITRRGVLALAAGLPALKACAPRTLDPLEVPLSLEVFPRTVLAGDTTSGSAVLAIFVATGVTPRLWVWREDAPDVLVVDDLVAPDADGFVKTSVAGLEPGIVYGYAWLVPEGNRFVARSLIGRFRTATAPGDASPVTVGFGACVGQGTILPDFVDPVDPVPFTWPITEVAGGVPMDAFVHLGDQAYLDRVWHEADGAYAAYLAAWGAYHGGGFRALYPQVALLATWDDHEVVDNGAMDPWDLTAEEADKLDAGQRAWFRVLPIDGDALAERTVWRSFRWGDTVELVLLDCRYERTADTLVSEAQLAWLVERIATSPCRFVCVCTPKPFADVQLDDRPYPSAQERWAGHPTQRDRVTAAIDALDRPRVVFVTGDIHMNYLGALDATDPSPSGRTWEVCCTSGNFNPFVRDLLPAQFVWSDGAPHLPVLTFDPATDTVTLRAYRGDGTVSFERALVLT